MIVKIAYNNRSEASRVNCLDNIDFYRQLCKAHFLYLKLLRHFVLLPIKIQL